MAIFLSRQIYSRIITGMTTTNTGYCFLERGQKRVFLEAFDAVLGTRRIKDTRWLGVESKMTQYPYCRGKYHPIDLYTKDGEVIYPLFQPLP